MGFSHSVRHNRQYCDRWNSCKSFIFSWFSWKKSLVEQHVFCATLHIENIGVSTCIASWTIVLYIFCCTTVRLLRAKQWYRSPKCCFVFCNVCACVFGCFLKNRFWHRLHIYTNTRRILHWRQKKRRFQKSDWTCISGVVSDRLCLRKGTESQCPAHEWPLSLLYILLYCIYIYIFIYIYEHRIEIAVVVVLTERSTKHCGCLVPLVSWKFSHDTKTMCHTVEYCFLSDLFWSYCLQTCRLLDLHLSDSLSYLMPSISSLLFSPVP